MDTQKIETLDQARHWHQERMAFFSHGGVPWGAMAHDSQQIINAIDNHLAAVAELIEALRHARKKLDDEGYFPDEVIKAALARIGGAA